MKKETESIQKLTIILFILMILIPIIFMNHEKDQISEIDNRTLTELPDTIMTAEGREQLDTYMEDRIGFRTWMLTQDIILNDRFFHVMEHPTYTYGKDDEVFFKIAYEWSVPYDYLQAYTYFVHVMDQYCNERGITFRYWLNPAKARIYSQSLPEGVHLEWKDTDVLLEQMDQLEVPYTWTADILKTASKNTRVFNRQYDAGHWNDTGAFWGNKELIQDLINQGVQIQPLEEEAFDKKRCEFDTLLVSYFPIEDSGDEYYPIDMKAKLDVSYDNVVELDPEYPQFVHYVNPDAPDAPKLLLFRGSYMDGRERFLADKFSELTGVESYGNILNFRYFIELFQPDVVVFECAEYVIYESMFPQESLWYAAGDE